MGIHIYPKRYSQPGFACFLRYFDTILRPWKRDNKRVGQMWAGQSKAACRAGQPVSKLKLKN